MFFLQASNQLLTLLDLALQCAYGFSWFRWAIATFRCIEEFLHEWDLIRLWFCARLVLIRIFLAEVRIGSILIGRLLIRHELIHGLANLVLFWRRAVWLARRVCFRRENAWDLWLEGLTERVFDLSQFLLQFDLNGLWADRRGGIILWVSLGVVQSFIRGGDATTSLTIAPSAIYDFHHGGCLRTNGIMWATMLPNCSHDRSVKQTFTWRIALV